MRMLNVILAVVVMMLAGRTFADDAANNPSYPAAIWATTMPAIELSGKPLEKVLDEIHSRYPDFTFSMRRVGVADSDPILPSMTLHHATIADFVQLVARNVPGVEIEFPGGFNAKDTFLPQMPAHPLVTVVAVPKIGSPVVRVFPLEDVIAYRASQVAQPNQVDREKQATSEILTVIQSACEMADETHPPEMQVHPPTHTLLFKGTAAQAEIAANALAALQPADDSHSLRGAFSAVVAENRELKEQLAKLKGATTQPTTERDATTRPTTMLWDSHK